MLITIKNLQQQTFTLNFEREKKVIELKEQIYKERGPEYVVEKQKLIYAGVILEDERTIASYNLDDKKFVVVMLKRDLGGVKQASDETQATQSASASASKDAAKNATAPSGVAKAAAEQSDAIKPSEDTGRPNIASSNRVQVGGTTAAATDSSSLVSVAESHLLLGDEYNRCVDSLMEMGYSADEIERAMGASYNNPDRAVEYLLSGIPEMDDGFNMFEDEVGGNPASRAESVRGTTNTGTVGAGTATGVSAATSLSQSEAGIGLLSTDFGGTTAGSGQDPFEFLRNQPQFLQMRSLVYQNPDLLHAVLQQIGQTNPALLQLISENQDAFLNMLNQPIEGGNARPASTGRRSQLADDVARIAAVGASRTSGNESGAGGDGPREANLRRADLGDAVASAIQSDILGAGSRDQSTERSTPAANPRIPNVVGDTGGGEVRRQDASSVSNLLDGDAIATIRLTPQDQVAIERLKALGFPETLVWQAYFACEKDEQLAANFLISSAFDD